MTRATSPHQCPHCRCTWDTTDDMGVVDRGAPFYSLVELIDAATARNQYGPRIRHEEDEDA